MDGERPPHDDVPGGGGPGRGKLPSGDGGDDDGGGGSQRGRGAGGGTAHEVLGDANLVVALFVLALFGLMQQLMAPPCTC
jgi:hypothetical protein